MYRYKFVILGLLVSILALTACSKENQIGSTAIPNTGAENAGLPTKISLLMNEQVTTLDGNSIGTVKDLVLGPQGLTQYVIVASDSKLLPIPWNAFAWNAEEKRLVFTESPDLLQDAPVITDWSTFDPSIQGWDDQVLGYWSAYVESVPESPVTVGQILPLTASSLVDQEVVLPTGDRIGSVNELLLRPKGGVPFLLLRTNGGFVPVPYNLFLLDAAQVRLVYTGSTEQLQSAPKFSKLEELDLGDTAWMQEVTQYWQVQ